LSAQLKIVQGDADFYPLNTWNRGGQSNPVYAQNDTLTAYLYQGQNLAPIDTLAVQWYTGNPPGSQTGYGQGQVLVSVTNAQSATLEAAGTYAIGVQWTPAANPTITKTIARVSLYVEPAPGTSTETITTYCQLSDMLLYAGWITIVQNQDVDGEGFYTQRLEARRWMDRLILNNYRGAFVGLFEELSTMAFAYGNVGWRRSLGPSYTLKTYLADDDLILNDDIVRVCAYKAISIIGLAQVGLNQKFASFGAYYRDMASREAMAITAEVDTSGNGQGNYFINLGATNTLRT
jgi:hypothetical protein